MELGLDLTMADENPLLKPLLKSLGIAISSDGQWFIRSNASLQLPMMVIDLSLYELGKGQIAETKRYHLTHNLDADFDFHNHQIMFQSHWETRTSDGKSC